MTDNLPTVASTALKIRIFPIHRDIFGEVACESDANYWFWEEKNYQKQDESGSYYRVRVPSASVANWTNRPLRYGFGTVERDPDQGEAEGTVEQTEADWVAVRLALEDIPDRSRAAGNVGEGADESDRPWLWEYRAPWRGITLLAGQPKSGKSTLLRGLLHAGDVMSDSPDKALVPFLGTGVRPYRTLVVTEELKSSWRNAPGNCRLMFVVGEPPIKAAACEKFIGHLWHLALGHRCEMICFDSFAAVCGADENSAKQIARAFAPLRRLAAFWTVLVVHHTTKYGTGSASVRGSSAIAASCDAVLTLACAGEDEADPRRILSAVGRFGRPHRLEYTMRSDGVLDLLAAKKRRTRSLLEGGA
jgi:hypothetical protein